MGVELLHQATYGYTSVLSSESHLLIWMCESDKLRHIGNPAQLIAEVIEDDSNISLPLVTRHLPHQGITVDKAPISQLRPAMTILELR